MGGGTSRGALALELDPRSPIVRLRYAISDLLPQGRLAEAIVELQHSLEMDPLSMYTRMWLVVMFWLACDYERAVEEGRELVESEPCFESGHMAIGQALCMAGRYEEAIASLRMQITILDSPMMRGWLGLALALGGRTAEARMLLEGFHSAAIRAYIPSTSLASIHFGLGEIDEAFVWLDKAIDERDHMMTPLETYPFLDPIRDAPALPGASRR